MWLLFDELTTITAFDRASLLFISFTVGKNVSIINTQYTKSLAANIYVKNGFLKGSE